MNAATGAGMAGRLPRSAIVTALSHDGRGIARVSGKTVFIEDALPGEEVTYRLIRRKRDYDEARLEEVLVPSADRVEPRCAHFGVCGGCALQHLSPAAQVSAKQQTLMDSLQRIGGVLPAEWIPPLMAQPWGYRRRARLSVRHVVGKGRVLVGFTERHKPFVTDTKRCEVLSAPIGSLIEILAETLGTLSIAARIPQVEVAVADNGVVLLLRVLDEPLPQDRRILEGFEDAHGVRVYLQHDRPESAVPLRGAPLALHYRLAQWDVEIGFEVADFIQVNADINRGMVARALEELRAGPGDQVLDLFCGLGNFTLPLARIAGNVTGVEGEAGLVARARRNAERNHIVNADFQQADLFADAHAGEWFRRSYDRILLDPPRAGAREIIAHFPAFAARRIVYVSCHPATLARDAKVLVEEQGYRFLKAGVLDMFPHTAHVESLAVFERS